MFYRIAICFIPLMFFYACEQEQTVTFNEDIAPIIHKNCTPCHRPGEAGPFSLITYQDVLRKAKTIKQVTQDKYMPPWPADKSYSTFLNERGLTDDEIDMIAKWVDQECPIGDTTIKVKPPEFPDGSQLGEPDLVLKMMEPYKIEGNNTDHFVVVKIPFELAEEKFVKTIEFVPDNRKLVHHANVHLINYEEDMKDDLYGGEMLIKDNAFDNLSTIEQLDLWNNDKTYPKLIPSIANYLPGVVTNEYPEGIGGFRMRKKGIILLKNIHYGPTPTEQYDQSYFNIFFTDELPKRKVREFQMGTSGVSKIEPEFILPPNTIKKFKTKFTLPEPISIITVNPHMHLLGKDFLAYAIRPNGDTVKLIRINEWDFRWQYFYTFPKMLKLEQGTNIYAFGTFDNTLQNPFNPYNPPRELREPKGYMKTTDEMFQLIITYLLYQDGDENISLDPNDK